MTKGDCCFNYHFFKFSSNKNKLLKFHITRLFSSEYESHDEYALKISLAWDFPNSQISKWYLGELRS